MFEFSLAQSCDADAGYSYALTYPMTYDDINDVIEVRGDDGTGINCGPLADQACDAMGWQAATPITFEDIFFLYHGFWS